MSTGLVLQLIGLQIVIFIVLAFLLRRVLRGHTESAVRRLQKLNEENLRREMDLKRKLDESEKKYKQRLAEAERIGLKIKEKSQKEAQETRDQIVARANEDRDEILTDAREEAEVIKTKSNQEIEITAVDKAVLLLKQTLSQELTKTLHNHFVDEVIQEITNLTVPRIESSTNTAEIISSQPLTEDQKKRLNETLTTKLGNKITISEKTDDHKDNIAGIYIKIGDFVLDGTLKNRINRQVSLIKENIKGKK